MRSIWLLLLLPGLLHADPARRDRFGDPLPDGAIQRLGSARMKHPLARRPTVSPDGLTVVTTGADRQVRIWSAQTGKLLRTLSFPPRGTSMSPPFLSEDGLRLVTFDQQAIGVWDLTTGKMTRRIPVPGVDRLSRVAFSPDPNVIATADDTPREHRIRLWNLQQGTHRVVATSEDHIHAMSFVGKDRLLSHGINAAGASATHSRLWNLSNPDDDRNIPGMPILDYVPARNPWMVFLTGDDPRSWEIWNLETGKQGENLPKELSDHFILWSSADGTRLFSTGTPGKSAVLIDRTQGKEVRRFRVGAGAFSPDSRRLFLLDEFTTLRCVSAITGEVIWQAADPDSRRFAFHLQWMNDSRSLLVSRVQGEQKHQLYDRETGAVLLAWDGTVNLLPPAIDRAQNLIYSCATQLEARSAPTEPQRKSIVSVPNEPEIAETLRDLAPTPDGRFLWLVQSTPNRHTAKFSRLDRSRSVIDRTRVENEMPIYFGGSRHATLSRDARLFVHQSHIMFTETGEELPAMIGHGGVDGLTLADGTDLVAGTVSRERPSTGDDPEYDFDLRIWERITGKPIADFPNVRTVCRAFHPSGRFLATDHPDGIRIWNISTQKLERHLPAHDTTFNDSRFGTYTAALSFSPDGRALASAHYDTTVLLWDTADLVTPPQKRLEVAAIQPLWQSLREPDARTAELALFQLEASPSTVLPFLRDQLQPVRQTDAETMQRLIAGLDAKAFRRREIATRQLSEQGDAALIPLQELLKKTISEDLRQRVTSVVEQTRWSIAPTGEDVQKMRALRLLERLGGKEATSLVARLATGVPTARVTQEAQATLERMAVTPAR